MDFSLDNLRRRLGALEPHTYSRATAPKRAAVAVVLRYRDDRPEVLLMQRADSERDRWSGHVSFPGGREEQHDADLIATAVRETREEVGVDLRESAELVGQLHAVRAIARGKILPMSITPYVFLAQREHPVTLNHEATDVLWLPLESAAAGLLDAVYPYRKGPLRLDLPCWRFEERMIWGLTYDMLTSLLDVYRR
ncbi:MAG TPA: CoA pyrophosphatase [Kofleriaceae bacterium]|nr:CoA pyrophosphatase [Kofleriaceae bacterium]